MLGGCVELGLWLGEIGTFLVNRLGGEVCGKSWTRSLVPTEKVGWRVGTTATGRAFVALACKSLRGEAQCL